MLRETRKKIAMFICKLLKVDVIISLTPEEMAKVWEELDSTAVEQNENTSADWAGLTGIHNNTDYF